MSENPQDPQNPQNPYDSAGSSTSAGGQVPPTPPREPGQPHPEERRQRADRQAGYLPTFNAVEAKGFFGALFDFSFTSFITVTFAKIIYVILIALVILGWLGYVIMGFALDPWAGVLALLLGWIPGFVMLVLIRVTIEFYIAMMRTSQNTAATVAELQSLRQTGLRS